VRYNRENCAVEITAQELCSVALRSGDIGGASFFAREASFDDKDMYYKLQSEAGAYYNTQVELCNTVLLDGIYFTVSLNADGVIKKGSTVCVDKIKCVRGNGFYAPPDVYTLSMLKCAAYFMSVRDGLDIIDGRVSYYNSGTKKLKYFKYRFLASELKTFYLDLLEKVKFRALIAAEREIDVIPSAESAVFPYTELREGQEIMIRECYSAIKRGKRVFIEAPTGTGKTISALFPAIRALGNGYCDKIFYLTPKTSTRREAFAAAAKLHSAGVMLRTVMISSKEQACACPARQHGVKDCCSSGICGYSQGYYDRVDSALQELLNNYRGYPPKLISEVARKHRVCPYELSLDLSEFCDIIICDYNYAFDPQVYFRRYFGVQRSDEKYVFLIDEAHNLADRAREMYSAQMRLSDIEVAACQISVEESIGSDIKETFSSVISAFKSIKKLCKETLIRDDEGNEHGFYMSSDMPERINRSLATLQKKSSEWMRKNERGAVWNVLYALSADIGKYLTVSEFFSKSFKAYCEVNGDEITVKLYCLDPSDIMSSLLTRARASIMFSATLTPTEYFCDVLGGGNNAERISLSSPFPAENLCVAVADYVNTRFETREDNAKRFATVIAASVTSKAGNYIAYFPSYQCLEQTYAAFSKKYPNVETVVQKRSMTVMEREQFLSAFKNDTGHLRVGFCVLGGVFSEGVDLPGSRLIGCIIFGVGLPGLSNEKNIIKEHFDLRSDEGIGYDYAYTFPGMNNVLQAAGRVIRTEEDRGIVILADDRYATPKYRMLFPQHWQNIKYVGNASSLAEIMRRFWKNQP